MGRTKVAEGIHLSTRTGHFGFRRIFALSLALSLSAIACGGKNGTSDGATPEESDGTSETVDEGSEHGRRTKGASEDKGEVGKSSTTDGSGGTGGAGGPAKEKPSNAGTGGADGGFIIPKSDESNAHGGADGGFIIPKSDGSNAHGGADGGFIIPKSDESNAHGGAGGVHEGEGGASAGEHGDVSNDYDADHNVEECDIPEHEHDQVAP
jgi:hypothetical protein